MAKHDMGPSAVAGFDKQCRKCKALDTEIKFALGENCPVEDPEPAPETDPNKIPGQPLMDISKADIRPMLITDEQRVKAAIIELQANWFHGFFLRQFHRACPPPKAGNSN